MFALRSCSSLGAAVLPVTTFVYAASPAHYDTRDDTADSRASSPSAPNSLDGVKDIAEFSLMQLLNPEVIGANRYQQHATEVAAPTYVISAQQIRARGYRDLKDIFFDLPGFDVSGNLQGEVRTLVILRGILGNQKLLVLQDGQRLNAITGERFLYGNNVPVHHAKRVELFYGPAAAAYGPDAYAGVINIVTKDGADIQGAQIDLAGGLLSANLESWATDGHVLLGHTFAYDSDAMLSARVYHTKNGPNIVSDYVELRPIAHYSDINAEFVHAEPVLDYDVYGKVRVGDMTLGGRFSDATEANGPSSIPEEYLYTKELVWRQKLHHVFLTHLLTTANLQAQTTARLQRYTVDPMSNFYITQDFQLSDELGWDGEPIRAPTSALREYKYAETLSVRIEEQASWFASDALTIGFGGLLENVRSFPKTRNLKEGRFDPSHLVVDMSEFADPQTGRVLGASNEAWWGVRPFYNAGVNGHVEYVPVAPLRLTFGARLDHNSMYGTTFNPRCGIVVRPDKETTLRAIAGTAYIQPSNYYVWENWANPFAMHIPNPDLEPERIVTVSAGGTRSLAQSVSVNVDAFYNRLTDIIRPVPAEGIHAFNPFKHPDVEASILEINANRGTQYTYGAELTVNYVRSNLHAYGSYAYLDGRDKASDLVINKISHHKVLLGADVGLWDVLHISPRLRWFSPVTMASSNDLYLLRQKRALAAGEDPDSVRTTFGHRTGTWLLNINITGEVTTSVRLYATLRNALNRAYYTASPYGESVWILPRAPQLRFNFMVGVQLDYQTQNAE